jgi:putative transcriptional regulator
MSRAFVHFDRRFENEIDVIRFRLGEQLEKKQFRDSRRITLQEVAEATGVNRSTLSKILNHKGYSTGTEVLDRLCAYFGCRIEDLAEYVQE